MGHVLGLKIIKLLLSHLYRSSIAAADCSEAEGHEGHVGGTGGSGRWDGEAVEMNLKAAS